MTNKLVICFDFDETLGSFSQLYKFWELIKTFLKNKTLDKRYFFNILDTFPLIFRPNIFKLLRLIKDKKKKKICDYVYIYTNNNGPKFWVSLFIDYIHYKLDYNLFDKIIRAYKINGRIIERGRTSHDKSYKDMITCTQLPKNSKVLFYDDQMHNYMKNNSNVQYIHTIPYNYNLNYGKMTLMFYYNNLNLFKNISVETFKKYIHKYIQYDMIYLEKSQIDKKTDYLITENFIKEFNSFIYENTKQNKRNITYKKKIKNHNITYKKS